MTIGEKIFTRRKQLGLTLEDVGQAVGVAKSTVKKWESGFIESMRLDKVEKLAAVLDISVDFLLFNDKAKLQDPAKRKLRSVARLEENELTEEEDIDLKKYIDFLISKRENKS